MNFTFGRGSHYQWLCHCCQLLIAFVVPKVHKQVTLRKFQHWGVLWFPVVLIQIWSELSAAMHHYATMAILLSFLVLKIKQKQKTEVINTSSLEIQWFPGYDEMWIIMLLFIKWFFISHYSSPWAQVFLLKENCLIVKFQSLRHTASRYPHNQLLFFCFWELTYGAQHIAATSEYLRVCLCLSDYRTESQIPLACEPHTIIEELLEAYCQKLWRV